MKRLAKLETRKTKRLMSQLKDNRAQQVSEYAILLAIVVAATIGMKIYVQRFLQAKYRAATLSVGTQLRNLKGNVNLPVQYEPYYLKSEAEAKESSNKQMSFLQLIKIGRSGPRRVTMQTSINAAQFIDTKQNQETLSGNYGD